SPTDPDRQPSAVAELRTASAQAVQQAKDRWAQAQRKFLRALVLPAPGMLSVTLLGAGSSGKIAAEAELAQLELRLAQARQQALEMLLRVEQVEDAGRKGKPEWESAALVAFTTQRIVTALEARREALVAAQAAPPRDAKARAQLDKQRART